MSNHTKQTNGHWREMHGSDHHVIARSIGGPNVPENKFRWNKKKHVAYHQLFYNYLPSTVIGIINLWTDQDGRLKLNLMRERNIRAWQDAFNGGTPAQVIKFIQKNFLPVEIKFLNGQLGGERNEKKR